MNRNQNVIRSYQELKQKIANLSDELAVARIQRNALRQRIVRLGLDPDALPTIEQDNLGPETDPHIVTPQSNRPLPEYLADDLLVEQNHDESIEQHRRQEKQVDRFMKLARASYLAGNEQVSERQYQAALRYATWEEIDRHS